MDTTKQTNIEVSTARSLLGLIAGRHDTSLVSSRYLRLGNHASLPGKSVNHAIQYLRMRSQDPPSQSNSVFIKGTCIVQSC